MYYKTTTKHTCLNAKGRETKIRTELIVECTYFAEAEQVSLSYHYKDGHEDAEVTSIVPTGIKELINNPEEGESIYKATLKQTYALDSGELSEMKYDVLLFANDINDAMNKMSYAAKQGYDMDIVNIKATKIEAIL